MLSRTSTANSRTRWYIMRRKVRLMRRLHRVRVTEGGLNYALRCSLSDSIKADIRELPVSGQVALQ